MELQDEVSRLPKVKSYEPSGPLLQELIPVSAASSDLAVLVHCRYSNLPAFCQVSLTVCWYPFILLGGERHCGSKVSYPRTQHKTWPGFKPRPLELESSVQYSTAYTRPLHLPQGHPRTQHNHPSHDLNPEPSFQNPVY